MKRLMKVETNAGTMFVTYDPEFKIVRVLDNEETNGGFMLSDVQDDSSWYFFKDVDNVEKWLGVDYFEPDSPKIVEEIEFE